MKTKREVLIMRKTYDTRRNNILKQLYITPYNDTNATYQLEKINELEKKIKILDWVLGDDKEDDNFITRLKKVFMRTKNS